MFPLGTSTKDSIVGILSVSWPLSAIKIWNALSKQSHSISYKAAYKALQELAEEKIVEKTENEYKLNEQWLKTTANTALEILKAYQVKAKITRHDMVANFTVYKYSDEFYRVLSRMLLTHDEIRLASRSPALLIEKESSKSSLRQKYIETMWKKIKEGEKVYYLFPTEVAIELVNTHGKAKVSSIIEKLEQYPNLQVRHAPAHSVVKMAIVRDEALIGLAAPPQTDLSAFLKIEGSNLSGLAELYNSIFANGRTLREII